MRAFAPNGTWSKTWRNTLAEFTGERLMPGEVDIDLLNEHMARYHFAVRLARGKRVLDAGCGAGYGSAELARAANACWMPGAARATDRRNWPTRRKASRASTLRPWPWNTPAPTTHSPT